MFHGISERIINYAVGIQALEQEKTEEYVYGLEITLSVLASYLSVLIIGFLLGMGWESVVFLVLFISIRRFAGGFHFSSQIACYTFTCLVSTAVLLTIKYVPVHAGVCAVIMIVSSLILLIFSPVPAFEKPLDAVEKVVYGRVARIIVILIDGIYLVVCLAHQAYLAKTISITVCMVAISLILGKVKQKLKVNMDY